MLIMLFVSQEPELDLVFQVNSYQYSTEERDFSFLCCPESQFAFSVKMCTVSTFNLASSRTTAPSQQLWDHPALAVDLLEVSVGSGLELFQISSAVCCVCSGCVFNAALRSAERCFLSHHSLCCFSYRMILAPASAPGVTCCPADVQVLIPAFGACCSCPF